MTDSIISLLLPDFWNNKRNKYTPEKRRIVSCILCFYWLYAKLLSLTIHRVDEKLMTTEEKMVYYKAFFFSKLETQVNLTYGELIILPNLDEILILRNKYDII